MAGSIYIYIYTCPTPTASFWLAANPKSLKPNKCQMSSNVNKSLQGCSNDAVSRSSIFHFPKVRLQEESSGSLDQDLRNTSKLQPKCLLCYLSSSHRALATALLPLQATMPTKVGLKLLFVGSICFSIRDATGQEGEWMLQHWSLQSRNELTVPSVDDVLIKIQHKSLINLPSQMARSCQRNLLLNLFNCGCLSPVSTETGGCRHCVETGWWQESERSKGDYVKENEQEKTVSNIYFGKPT